MKMIQLSAPAIVAGALRLPSEGILSVESDDEAASIVARGDGRDVTDELAEDAPAKPKRAKAE